LQHVAYLDLSELSLETNNETGNGFNAPGNNVQTKYKKSKVKHSLYTPWRRLGGEEV
jgi:hypothetical protein